MLFNQICCETEFKYDQKKILEYIFKISPNSENNILIIQNMLKIFKNINENSREEFILFLSVIYSYFDGYGLLNYPLFKKQFKSLLINKYDYTFMTSEKLIEELFYSKNCKGNCIYGFHSLVEENNSNEEVKNLNKISSIKEEKIANKDEQILKVFDNKYCTLEEDWDDWLKSCIKTLLEKSSSPYISNLSVIADYYLSFASELSSQGFYSFFTNIRSENQKQVENILSVALNAPKATYSVILSILDLIESMERKKLYMHLNDYDFYGNICYKLKAYTKSLYYLERSFLNNKNDQTFEKLLYLYCQLGIPECAYGLMRLVDKNNYEDIKNYENKFIWYMNLGNYRKALEMIEEQLSSEKNEEKIYFLKSKKNFCKSELFDWEEILLEEENSENLDLTDIKKNDDIDKYEEVKEVIEKEIFYAVSCSNLGKWDHLGTHISKINRKIKEKFDIEELNELFGDDIDINVDMNFGRISREKINSSNQNDKKCPSNYISYNQFVLKNASLLNQIDQAKIFDLNLISSLVYVMEGNFEVAKKYKEDAKELILYEIKPLIKESHSRGYSLLINNQQLSYLEDIIEYKENHEGDLNYLKDMKKLWDKSFSQISFEPAFCRRLLFLYRFIFPKKELLTTEIIFGNILRKYGFYEQSKAILKNQKIYVDEIIKEEKEENNLLFLNEQKIKMHLSYNKTLFNNGEFDEAAKKGKILVDLLNNTNKSNIYQKISDKLKGKIYGEYALYIKGKFFSLDNQPTQINETKTKDHEYYYLKSNYRHFSPRLAHRNIFLLGENNIPKLKSKIIPKNSVDKNNESFKPYLEHKKIYDANFDEYFNSNHFKNDIKKLNNINHYLKLATKYYDKSHKYWFSFSDLNYHVYRHLHLKRIMAKEKGVDTDSKNMQVCKMFEVSFAKNTIEGIKKCLSLIGTNIKKGYQSCIKLTDIFFNLGGENNELLESIYEIITEVKSIIFILILPILISRIGINNKKILDYLIKIFVNLCLNFPGEAFIHILIYKYSNSAKKKSIANKILYLVEQKNPKLKILINNYDIFIKELNRCSLLLHEKWIKAIEETSKMLSKKNYKELVDELEKVHKLMNKNPDNLYDINFNQCYYSQLNEAHNYLEKYIKTNNKSYIKLAWEKYQTVYRSLKEKYNNMSTIYLKYVSPLLSEIPEKQIGLPGYYFLNKLNKERKQLIIGNIKENNSLETEDQQVFIKRIDKYLYVFKTKQKPRKISFIGTDDKEYKYLLKSNEDLRQDERIIQVFNFVNSLLSLDKEQLSKKLLITVYPVIPLSNLTGLIGFLPNCDTISHLIIEARKEKKIHPNIEMLHIMDTFYKYSSGTLLSKLEVFKEAVNLTSGYELGEIIWTKSLNCETWLTRRTNYAQSLAVMSVVGYILGLGDRHPNNLMMDRQNGKIIHIDYGDCFEIASKRKKFPEKIPFRLTRMFVKALGISGVEGTFRIISEKIMRMLRNNKDSLYTILNSLVYDPLVTFKLMLPLMKKNEEKEKPEEEKEEIEENTITNNKNNSELNVYLQSSSVNVFHPFDNLEKKMDIVITPKEKEKEKEMEKENNQYKLENEKEEKIIISNEERKLLYYYEANDEIEFEDLNKTAQNVLNRIMEKLTGTDFNNKKPLEVGEQIDRLIKQAVNEEILCQLYVGWSPFW